MFTSRALFLFALTFLVLSLVHFDSAAVTALRIRAPYAEEVKLRQFNYKNPALRIRKAGASVSSSMSPSPTPSSSSRSSRTISHTQTTTTHRG